MVSPKISIITISFNAELYIERTIKSVNAQTYPHIEFIIIDGASKDKTVDIIKQYKTHISKWISEPDKSHFDAMNKGLALATGDYVWYMNAGDCIAESTTLANIVKEMKGADFIYGDTIIVKEDGSSRPWYKQKPAESDISYKSFRNGMVVCHHSMMAKRHLVPQYALAPWKVSNDIDWSIRLAKACKTFRETSFVWCKYLDGGISDKNRIKAVKERFDISVKHFGLFPTLYEQVKILFQVIKRGKLS